jgi:hypothetical protein
VKGRRFISIAGVVVVAMVAAAISFRHQSSLAAHNGQPSPWAYIYPASIDGLIATTAALIATDRATGARPRTWAVFGFWLGVGVSIVTNWLAVHGGVVAHGLSAFPALAFLIAVEALSSKPRARKSRPELPVPMRPEVPAQLPVKTRPAARKPSPKTGTRRPAVETRKLAAAALAEVPQPTRAEVAGRLGISDRQLRTVLNAPELDRMDPRVMPLNHVTAPEVVK